MKLRIYIIALLVLCLIVSACSGASTSDVEPTEQAALAATRVVQSTNTPAPPTNTPM